MLAQPITLIAIVSALFGPPVEGARRCSLIPFPVSRDSATTVILGMGASETASVGAGGVSYSRFGGHWGRSLFGPIRAQSVRVREVSGAQAAEIAAHLRASTDSTVWGAAGQSRDVYRCAACAPRLASREANIRRIRR